MISSSRLANTQMAKARQRPLQDVGVMMEGDNGPYLLLDRTFNPAGVGGNEGRESIIVSLYEPKEGGGQQSPAAKSGGYKARDLDGDDVPFN